MPAEKCTEQIKIHLSEKMLRDVQDMAMREDRAVSEWIRHRLRFVLYGERFASLDRAQVDEQESRDEQGLMSRRRREEISGPADYPVEPTDHNDPSSRLTRSRMLRALGQLRVRFSNQGREGAQVNKP